MNRYREQKKHFQGMKDKILGIYFEDVTKGYSHKELANKFSSRYPMISVVNLQRRTCELAEENWLWKDYGSDKTVRFYLKLSKLVDEEKEEENPASKVKQLKFEGDDK